MLDLTGSFDARTAETYCLRGDPLISDSAAELPGPHARPSKSSKASSGVGICIYVQALRPDTHSGVCLLDHLLTIFLSSAEDAECGAW